MKGCVQWNPVFWLENFQPSVGLQSVTARPGFNIRSYQGSNKLNEYGSIFSAIFTRGTILWLPVCSLGK